MTLLGGFDVFIWEFRVPTFCPSKIAFPLKFINEWRCYTGWGEWSRTWFLLHLFHATSVKWVNFMLSSLKVCLCGILYAAPLLRCCRHLSTTADLKNNARFCRCCGSWLLAQTSMMTAGSRGGGGSPGERKSPPPRLPGIISSNLIWMCWLGEVLFKCSSFTLCLD